MRNAQGIAYKEGQFAEFPAEEYAARYARVATLMTEHGIDALVLTDKANLRYFAGLSNSTNAKGYYFFCVLPSDTSIGPIVLIYHGGDRFADLTWIHDVRFWNREPPGETLETHPGILETVKTLSGLGIDNGTIGVELDAEMRVHVGQAHFQQLLERLPHASIIDAGPLIWKLRKIKSLREQDCLRRAARITLMGIRKSMEELRPGMTEREVASVMVREWYRQGASAAGFNSVYGGERFMWSDCLPSNNRFESGDMIHWDVGCIVDGYWSDLQRHAVVGQPSAEQVRHFDTARRLLEVMVAEIRPGTSGKDLAEAAYPVYERSGFGDFAAWCRETGFGLPGHNIGLDVHEPPLLRGHDDAPLEPGQVVCIEPFVNEGGLVPFWEANGKYSLEAVVLVTDDGHEILSSENILPLDLWIVD